MQQGESHCDIVTTLPCVFQSSSSQKAGCNGPMDPLTLVADAGIHWLFQSSSSQKAGCNPATGAMVNIVTISPVFQSSSSQKAGCNAASL